MKILLMVIIMNVLITGSASGIGYATGKFFLEKGYNVYLTTETEKQLEVLNEKNNLNFNCFKLDVTNENDRKKLENLDIDIFISNAAIGIGGSILEANMDDVRKSYEINVFSNFETIKIVLENMLKKNSGRIIIMSSMISNISLPFLGIYSSTKASISMLGKCLRKEINLVNKNIDIVLIEPGIYKTGFNKVMLDNKYGNSYSRFLKLNESIMNFENEILNCFGNDNLNSIVHTIYKASTDKKTKSIYRAPLLQNIFIKLYIKLIKK